MQVNAKNLGGGKEQNDKNIFVCNTFSHKKFITKSIIAFDILRYPKKKT